MNESSSRCVSRTVSMRDCRWCICHCMRRTNPRITRAMVMKMPSVQWRESKRLFISERRSSMRVLSLHSPAFRSSPSFFWPSSSLFISPLISVSPSTISRSEMRGATSTAIAGRWRITKDVNSMKIPNALFMS